MSSKSTVPSRYACKARSGAPFVANDDAMNLVGSGHTRGAKSKHFATLPVAPGLRQVEMQPFDVILEAERGPITLDRPRPARIHNLLTTSRRILLPATVLCLLNALKPLTVDDPAYYAFAS